MAPPLFALKEDLDMITQDVATLKSSYTSIDHIARRFDDLWKEQLFQSKQMDRMASDISDLKKNQGRMQEDIRKICLKLNINPEI